MCGTEVGSMDFWAGAWLHSGPDRECSADGRRMIVKHLRFGPAETQIWYEVKDGRYCCELHIIEGLQAGGVFVDWISRDSMRKVLENEIALCEKYGKMELGILFRAEIEKVKR